MCSTGPRRRSRHTCHDPEDWPCEGPPWLCPTDGLDCEEPDCDEPDCDEPDDEEPEDDEPDDEDPEESVPFDEVPLPDDVPEEDDPVEPEVVEAVDCEPEKRTAEVMPAAARLDSPTIEVTQAAVRLPAERESMCSTSGVVRFCLVR